MAAEWSLVYVNFTRGLDQKTDDFSQEASRLLVGKNVRFYKLGLLEKRFGHRSVAGTWFFRNENNGATYNLDAFKKRSGRILGDYRGSLVVSDGYSLGTYASRPLSNNNSLFLPESFLYADQVPEATVEWRGVASHDSWVVNQDVAYGDGFVAHVYECFAEGTANSSNTWNSFVTVEDHENRSPVVSHKRLSSTATQKLRKPRVCWVGSARMLIAAYDANDTRVYTYYWTPVLAPQSVSATGNYLTGLTAHLDMVSIGGNYAGLCVVESASKKIAFYSIYKDGTPVGPLYIATGTGTITAVSMSYNSSTNKVAVVFQDVDATPTYSLWHALIDVSNPVAPTISHVASKLFDDLSTKREIATVSSCLLMDNSKTVVVVSAPTIPMNDGHSFNGFPSGSGYMSRVISVDTVGVVTGQYTLAWCTLSSRPFRYAGQNDRVYCSFNAGGARYDTTVNALVADSTSSGGVIGHYVDQRYFTDTAQWSSVLVDLGLDSNFEVAATNVFTARPVAVALPRTSHPNLWGAQYMCPSSTIAVTSSKFVTTTPGRSSNDGRSFVTELSYNFLPDNHLEPSQLGEGLEMSGGVPSIFDGHRVSEIGFIFSCEKLAVGYSSVDTTLYYTAANFGAGLRGPGILIPGGDPIDIQYLAIPRYVDKRGEVHRGTPSDVLTLHFDSIDPGDVRVGFKVRIPCITLTTRQDVNLPYPQIVWELYRTTNGGADFYLVNDYNIFLETEFVNDPTKEYIDVLDTRPDEAVSLDAGKRYLADLTSQPTPYTTGGVLPNAHPGCLIALKTFRKRLLGLSGDRKTCWFSKLYVTGEAVSFTDGFTIAFDETVDVVAIGTMDNKAIFWSDKEIYKIEGEGPTDTGVGYDYGTPERIASDVGCTSQRSVLEGPDGLYFMATPGIYKLTRDLNVEFVGSPVEDITKQYPVVTSAMMIPDQQLLVWTLSADSAYPSATEGVRVVYNYLFNAWSHDEIRTTQGESKAIISQSLWDRYPVILDEMGVVYFEDSTTNLDIGHWVEYEATTGYLRIAGMQGWQIIRMLGILAKEQSPHDLIVEVANDFSDNYHQTFTITHQMLRERSLELFRFFLSRRKNTSLKVRIRDRAPTEGSIGTGKGLSLRSLSFDVMQVPGLARTNMEK